MEKKKMSQLALASFIISICSGIFPMLLSFVGSYFNIPVFPFAGYLGIFFGICAVAFGIGALVIIFRNKTTLSGYTRAILGIVIAIGFSCVWFDIARAASK
ncbi:MAG: hypothetical protein A2166_06740 [Omnitrophica WOR_2 bacterium RBG_13_41_10]|nr:MAG: hypothetical protein A2166_06740 [Omnitrophica WOR_2 bacterium RBG_13_41_10]